MYNYRNIDELIKLADNLGISSGELIENLETIYEWEYKYHKILQSQRTMPKRKEWLLHRINLEMRPVLNSTIKMIKDGLYYWIKQHTIYDADTWAKNRTEELLDVEDISSDILYEYTRYVSENPSDYINDLINSNERWFTELGEELIQESLDMYEQEFESAESEEEKLDSQVGIDYYTGQDPLEYASEYIMSTGTYEFINKDILFNLYKEVIFPAWYDYWNEDDKLDETYESITTAYNYLDNINIDNLKDTFTIINKTLNLVHRTGSILDYIEGGAVSEDDLLKLSDSDVSKWDKELTSLGIRY